MVSVVRRLYLAAMALEMTVCILAASPLLLTLPESTYIFPAQRLLVPSKGRLKFSNLSTATVTSLYELNIPEWDVEQQTYK